MSHDFHLSGLRRVEIEPSGEDAATRRRAASATFGARGVGASSTATAPATRLVLIGPGIDPEAALARLREMETNVAVEGVDDDEDETREYEICPAAPVITTFIDGLILIY